MDGIALARRYAEDIGRTPEACLDFGIHRRRTAAGLHTQLDAHATPRRGFERRDDGLRSNKVSVGDLQGLLRMHCKATRAQHEGTKLRRAHNHWSGQGHLISKHVKGWASNACGGAMASCACANSSFRCAC
jgi:hypothetical protein